MLKSWQNRQKWYCHGRAP